MSRAISWLYRNYPALSGMLKAEAERLLEECDKLRSQTPARAVWFDRWKKGGK